MRITRKHLEAKVGIVNRLLGFGDDHPPYSTIGAVTLYGAYGGHGVHQWCNDAGGCSDLMGHCGTANEANYFLSGMIAALRIATEKKR